MRRRAVFTRSCSPPRPPPDPLAPPPLRPLIADISGASPVRRRPAGPARAICPRGCRGRRRRRSEEHTSVLQSLMRLSYAVFCLKKQKTNYLLITLYHAHTKTTNT